MTLLQLRYFIVLAKNLHYTRSAQQLHISQPSLSYAIAELEKELNVPLFEKTNKKIQLNRNGQLFLHYAENALSTLDEGVYLLQSLNGVHEQRIRLGYFYSLSAPFIPSLISRFYSEGQRNNILFDFVQEQDDALVQSLQTGGLDLAFCLSNGEKLECAPVMRQELYLIVGEQHPLASRETVCFDEFYQEPLILLTQKSQARKMIDDVFARRHQFPHVISEAVECNAALQFVSLGLGVSILPRIPALDSAPVRCLPIEGDEFSRTVYLAWRPDETCSPPVTAFRDFILSNGTQ